MGYGEFIAHLGTGTAGKLMRIGCFRTRLLSPANPFAHFGKADFIAKAKRSPQHSKAILFRAKVHVSVRRDDVPEAWKALRPLLLSRDNPFPTWKMTVLENLDRHVEEKLGLIALMEGKPGFDAEKQRSILFGSTARVSEGMQFTLYPHARAEDPDFVADGPEIRDFLTLMEQALVGQGLSPGTIPTSDAGIPGLRFATFRKEGVSSRGAEMLEEPVTREMLANLRKEPFFRAISQS